MKTNTNTNEEFAKCLLTLNRAGGNETPAVIKESMNQAAQLTVDEHMLLVSELLGYLSVCKSLDLANHIDDEILGSNAEHDAFVNKIEAGGRHHRLLDMLNSIHAHDNSAMLMFKTSYTEVVREFDATTDFENQVGAYVKILEERIDRSNCQA